MNMQPVTSASFKYFTHINKPLSTENIFRTTLEHSSWTCMKYEMWYWPFQFLLFPNQVKSCSITHVMHYFRCNRVTMTNDKSKRSFFALFLPWVKGFLCYRPRRASSQDDRWAGEDFCHSRDGQEWHTAAEYANFHIFTDDSNFLPDASTI